MKKAIWTLCLLLGGCSPAEPRTEGRPEPGERDETEEPGTSFSDPEQPDFVAPKIDGFDWVDYGPDAVKVQFRIHNAEECEMQSATILYGPDADNLVAAATDVYANGIIVATIRTADSGVKRRYLVACEVTTPAMVYRTEYYSITF